MYKNYKKKITNLLSQFRLAERIKKQLRERKFVDSTNTWSDLEEVIERYSNQVVYIYVYTSYQLLMEYT